MAEDPTDVMDKRATAQDVTLRDESDEIIDDLKRQLAGLKGRLAAYESGEPGARAENAELVRAWNDGLAPHLATRLQVPAQELTGRLERLIDQADDPELRQELERCREIAFYLFDTFRKITTSHHLLTESLTAPKVEVEVADFCRLLEHVLPRRGTPLPVTRRPGLPRRIRFASRSASTVMGALAELATALFGAELAIEVSDVPPEGGEGEPAFIRFRITAPQAGEEAPEGDEVAAFAMRKGITPETVVDLLYVEKIVELQGGAFAFARSQGRVVGVEVRLAYERLTT